MQEMTVSYATARLRNLSRYSTAKTKKCAAMRAAKERKRIESSDLIREPEWQPPALRRILAVIEFDTGRPVLRMMQLRRGDRIDTYRIRTPRGESARSIGFSRALAVVRKAMPRMAA